MVNEKAEIGTLKELQDEVARGAKINPRTGCPIVDEPKFRALHNTLGCPGCKFEDGEKTFKGPCCTKLDGPAPDETGHCEAARYPSKMPDGSTEWVSVPSS